MQIVAHLLNLTRVLLLLSLNRTRNFGYLKDGFTLLLLRQFDLLQGVLDNPCLFNGSFSIFTLSQ
jgi:hypothetical protein